MKPQDTIIDDAFAEAFNTWNARLIVTADDTALVDQASNAACGYGTSIIGCDAEAGVEMKLAPDQTPDGRSGASLIFAAMKREQLIDAVRNRTGQCLMTCPTTAVFDGLNESSERIGLGDWLRYFGDGHEQRLAEAGRACWSIPAMDGGFAVERTMGLIRGVGGGMFIICGRDRASALAAARRAVDAIAGEPGVMTPFPGGICRCGSKVGSRYRGLIASINDPYCPTLRDRPTNRLPADAGCAYEIVIDGLGEPSVRAAMASGMAAACGEGVLRITASDYGGRLGRMRIALRELIS